MGVANCEATESPNFGLLGGGDPYPLHRPQCEGGVGVPSKLLDWSPSSLSTTHPSYPAQGSGVDLAQGSTIEGHWSAPTRDPTLHFGPKLRLGRQDLAGRALWH